MEVKFSMYLNRCVFIMRCGAFSCFVQFVVFLLCFVDPVYHCDHLVAEQGAGCFSSWSVAVVLSVMVCVFFVFPLRKHAYSNI